MFPEVEFTAVDSIGKKITVVREVASALGLTNVTPINARIEAVKGEFDYVVSRAVTDMKTLKGWALPKLRSGQAGSLPNGMIVLKGGDLAEEIAQARLRCDIHRIGEWFEEEFFETKQVIYARK
jgi:16S rRNA (guanine527-N7)-methyltransferase